MTSPNSQPAKDNAKLNPFLWFHLVLMAIAPWLLVMTMAGLAVGDPLLPSWLEILVLGLPAIALPAWWQWQQPFSPFSLWLAAKPKENLSDRDRQMLALLKQQNNGWYITGWIAIAVAMVTGVIFAKLYDLAPLAQAIAPFPDGLRFFGIIYAEICLFLSNILLQSGISALRLYLVTEPELDNVQPIAIEKIKNSFTSLNFLPASIADPLLKLFDVNEPNLNLQDSVEPTQPVIQQSSSEALPVLEVHEPVEIVPEPVLEPILDFADNAIAHDATETSPEPIEIISEYDVSTPLLEPEPLVSLEETTEEGVSLAEAELEIAEFLLNEDILMKEEDLPHPAETPIEQELQEEFSNITDESPETSEPVSIHSNPDEETTDEFIEVAELQSQQIAIASSDSPLIEEELDESADTTELTLDDPYESDGQDEASGNSLDVLDTDMGRNDLIAEVTGEIDGFKAIDDVKVDESVDILIEPTTEITTTNSDQAFEEAIEEQFLEFAEINETEQIFEEAIEEPFAEINETESECLIAEASEELIEEPIAGIAETREIETDHPTEDVLSESLDESLEEVEEPETRDSELNESSETLPVSNPSTIAPKSQPFNFLNVPYRSGKQKPKTQGFGKPVKQESIATSGDDPNEVNEDATIKDETEEELDERALLDNYVENVLYDYLSEPSDDV